MIEFAASRCEELIVSMSYTDADIIDPQLRFGWIKEQFKNNLIILPRIIKDDFDNEQLALPERTAIRAQKIQDDYPRINVLISSEPYGLPFAQNMGAELVIDTPWIADLPRDQEHRL